MEMRKRQSENSDMAAKSHIAKKRKGASGAIETNQVNQGRQKESLENFHQ